MHIFIFEKQNSSIKTGTTMSDCTATSVLEWISLRDTLRGSDHTAVTRYHKFTVHVTLQIFASFTSITSGMHDQHSRVLIRRLSASGSERARINKACFMRPLTELTPASDTVGTQTCGSSSASQAEKKRAVNGLNFRLCV